MAAETERTPESAVTAAEGRRLLDRSTAEERFAQQIIDLAKTFGYSAYHTRDSQRSEYGYPDLTLVNLHPGRRRLIYAEIKTEGGVLRYSQEWWLTSLSLAGLGVVESYCWRPSQWEQIVEVLGPVTQHTHATFDLRLFGGYAHRLTEEELLLGPRGVAELHREIRRKP